MSRGALLSCLLGLGLCGPAAAADFAPIEVGNRWVYVHEVYDGMHVGSYSIDTCGVEITAASFETHDGRSYQGGGIGNPCASGPVANLRRDGEGNIVMRVEQRVAPPDTTAFLNAHPDLAEPFRQRLRSWPAAGDEILYLDFGLAQSNPEPFVQAYLGWYGDQVDRVLGYHAVRRDEGELDRHPWQDFGRPIPSPFTAGAERCTVTYRSSILAMESSTHHLLEDGVGLVAEHGESIITIGHSTTVLLWARVGGVEYGDRETVAGVRSGPG